MLTVNDTINIAWMAQTPAFVLIMSCLLEKDALVVRDILHTLVHGSREILQRLGDPNVIGVAVLKVSKRIGQ